MEVQEFKDFSESTNFSEVRCFNIKSVHIPIQDPCWLFPLLYRFLFSSLIPISRQSWFLSYAMLNRYLHLAHYLPRLYLHLSLLRFRPCGMVQLQFHGYGCISCVAMFLINPILLTRIVRIIHGDPSLRASYHIRMLESSDGY